MRALGIRLAVGALVLAVMLGGRLLLGAPIGDPCSDAFLCNAFPARCLVDASGGDGYCSRPCEAPADCDAGWSCVSVPRLDASGALVEVEPVCLRPGESAEMRHTIHRR